MMFCPNGFMVFNEYSKRYIQGVFSLSMRLWEKYEHIGDFPQEGFIFQVSIIILFWHNAQKSLLLVNESRRVSTGIFYNSSGEELPKLYIYEYLYILRKCRHTCSNINYIHVYNYGICVNYLPIYNSVPQEILFSTENIQIIHIHIYISISPIYL